MFYPNGNCATNVHGKNVLLASSVLAYRVLASHVKCLDGFQQLAVGDHDRSCLEPRRDNGRDREGDVD